MNTLSTLLPADREMFDEFNVSADMLSRCKVWRATDAESRAQRHFNGTGNNAGLVFDYFDPFDNSRWISARIRRDHPPVDKQGKPEGKYQCQAGKPSRLFVVPGQAALLKDRAIPLVLVEAEKSAIAGTSYSERNGKPLLFVATGGVWNWQKDGVANPDLNWFSWSGRAAYILFDSNSTSNPNVKLAQSRLAAELKGRGSNVFVATLPQAPGVNGPDDAIAILGDAALTDVLTAAVPFTDDWRAQLLVTKDGTIKPQLTNAALLLRHDPAWAGVLAFNEFSLFVETVLPPPFAQSGGEVWTDDHDSRTACWLQNAGCAVTSKQAHEAVQMIARENPFHPIRRYLANLVWDQQSRCNDWLHVYLGAEDTPLNTAIGSRWLIQAVARVMQPGSQCDGTLLMIGEQGIKKSTTLRVMAGAEYFTDALTDLGSKDSRQELRGRWIVEMSEFVSRRSELERKGFLTARSDYYRAPYERCPKHVPRSNVFAATSNDPTPLGDETGGRRYWPVTCGEIDIEALQRDRDQLWAEAYVRYSEGEPWHVDFPEFQQALEAEQESRYVGGALDAAILPWLDNPKRRAEDEHIDRTALRYDSQPGRVTINDCLLHACGKAQHSISQRDRLDARACLIHAGWKQEKLRKISGSNNVARFYVRKGTTIL